MDVDDGVRRVAVYEDVGQAAHELAQLGCQFKEGPEFLAPRRVVAGLKKIGGERGREGFGWVVVEKALDDSV